MRAWTLSLLLPLLLAPACTPHRETRLVPAQQVDHRADRKLPAAIQADADAVVQGNTAFALDLYGRLKVLPGNLFLSPFSISSALAMTWAGARNATESEMAGVLHFTLPQDRLHNAFGALQKSLDTGNSFAGYRVSIANRLFGQQGYPWLSPFLAVTRDAYNAELQSVDFEKAPEPARLTINGWVAQRTEGLIPELFPAGSIDSFTRLALANAIYFKGRWASQFDPASTTLRNFTLGNGSRIQVPTMIQECVAGFYQDPELTAVELPYEGQDIAMLILLPPSADGLPALESRLSSSKLAAWRQGLMQRSFFVDLPRFSVKNSYDLPPVLFDLGMPRAFDPNAADLSGMDGRLDLYIQRVVHQALVKVDEEGTVAMAATATSAGASSAPPPLIVSVDHPFLFLLTDRVTGSILFMGRVTDPSQG